MWKQVAVVVVLLLLPAPSLAQVQSRPTDPPLVTAINEAWYRLREPIQFAGDMYYPAGPAVFFDGNVMVRTGHYNGVPLYANTTLEPYSVVLVPISRGLMQPYERRRRGDVAGTTASRTPSFPVGAGAQIAAMPESAAAPTAAPLPLGAIPAYTPEVGSVGSSGRNDRLGLPLGSATAAARPVGTGGRMVMRSTEPAMVSVRRPESNDGLWIRYGGKKWVSAGPAVAAGAAAFTLIGDYAGFPVYARSGGDRADTIYLPTRAGHLAPYKRKP